MKTKLLLGFLLAFAVTACSAAIQGVKVKKGEKTYELEKGNLDLGKKKTSGPNS
ncbi:MAG: hypothetical protein ACE5G9_10040 [Nitrospinales bacterium]